MVYNWIDTLWFIKHQENIYIIWKYTIFQYFRSKIILSNTFLSGIVQCS
jgi:hypothetical protein